jgi:hypothetical protein
MSASTGTRTRQNVQKTATPSESESSTHTRDVGMTKNVTASCTFVNSTTKQVQAANGTFAAFALNDLILVERTNHNNGDFVVTAIDTVNQAYLTLAPSPSNEGPLTATIRSA